MLNEYRNKTMTAEQAVALAVKDGDWVDYGFGGGFPELLDKALAARKASFTAKPKVAGISSLYNECSKCTV